MKDSKQTPKPEQKQESEQNEKKSQDGLKSPPRVIEMTPAEFKEAFPEGGNFKLKRMYLGNLDKE